MTVLVPGEETGGSFAVLHVIKHRQPEARQSAMQILPRSAVWTRERIQGVGSFEPPRESLKVSSGDTHASLISLGREIREQARRRSFMAFGADCSDAALF
jgi:hypothetical protein